MDTGSFQLDSDLAASFSFFSSLPDALQAEIQRQIFCLLRYEHS